MAKKEFTLTSKFLLSLVGIGDILFMSPYEFRRRVQKQETIFANFSKYKSLIYYLKRKGYIRLVDKNNQRFLKLTAKGQLQGLLARAKLPQKPQKWDGKWRIIIFDIPEESRSQRNFFRKLLKTNGFKMLQASVFVSPYPMNKEAIEYLKRTKLLHYIRIFKVEQMDDDKDLQKMFKLL